MSNERKPHKHAEVIKQWADGAMIEMRAGGGEWLSVIDNRPYWTERNEYRVKPEPVKVRYRVALCKRGDTFYPTIVSHECDVTFTETYYSDFAKWIHTEWQEAEVPQQERKRR